MRIIPDDVWAKDYADLEYETIEITDEDWVQIIMWFIDNEYYPNEFPQYLDELIKLKIASK